MATAAAVRRLAPVLSLLLLIGCRAEEDAPPPARPAPTPEAAVHRLLDDLRRDDLGAYAVHALPPDLYARTDAAWRAGHSRWPLSELPLARHLPRAVDTLSAPGAETLLRSGYRKQFAGEHAEVRSAARTLGLFAGQMLERDAAMPAAERAHRRQLLAVLVAWGEDAPLADASRIEPLLPTLVRAAKATRLEGGQAAWSQAGMHRSLTRLRPALRALKRGLATLGLDVGTALRSARVESVWTRGDRARLRLRYPLGGREIVADLDLERRPEGWFLVDSLRHAQAALAPDAPTGPSGGPGSGVRHNAGDGPADAPALPRRTPPR